jgi:hypothetical protein
MEARAGGVIASADTAAAAIAKVVKIERITITSLASRSKRAAAREQELTCIINLSDQYL